MLLFLSAEQVQKARKEVANHVPTGKDEQACVHVEHVIWEDLLVEAMEILEPPCDLLLARFSLFQAMNSTMVVGKNKRLRKGSKKGAKKKVIDPFSKKDWYDVKAPAMFYIRNIGKTLVTRTQGTKIASDGLKGRVFENNQIRKTSYAQHQQVRQIRKKMMEIMTWEVQTNDLKEVTKLIPDSIGKDVEKAGQSIYPLYDVFVRKVKVLKKPKFELGKLMELHGEGSSSGKATGDETGAKVERADGYEPPVQESV
ncbi:40S ribosomal protein S3a [Tupaia chinensis]|uniref:IST1 homolog n=1 Tax=Tupaia chinensis TaxID=246437 RepID=L9KJE9_TUPCH|nr:40S ribosomal protein S3a [Tupaia chinensis]